MANIAPLDAVADSVAAYFAGAVTDLKAIRGWPERSEDLDLDGADGGAVKAVLSVFVSPNYEIERCVPTEVDRVLNAGKFDLLYRVGFVTGRLQLDLWAGHRATRDTFANAITEVSANRLPQTSDLRLSSTGFFGRDGYHSRPSKTSLRIVTNQDQGSEVEVGQWRKTWTADVSTDIVLPSNGNNRIESIRLDLTTCRGGILITEARTVPP